jgi:hypothetical protein
MKNNNAFITEAKIFSGFGKISRALLIAWKNFIIQFDDTEINRTTLKDMSRRLRSSNIIVFFDHHYAFDAIPMGLAFGINVRSLRSLLIPYAVHLDMGVGRKGEFSVRYKSRTLVFSWFARSITKNNPSIRFMPTVREFEMETPRLREIVEGKYDDVNTKYIRTFVRIFSRNGTGQACFLSPFSGIGFPGKPALHPQLHRSVKLAHAKSKREISFYLVGAYPNWHAQRQYYAPLMSRHTIAMRGPIELPIKDYEKSRALMESEISQLRQQANFTLPDYDRILMK